MSKKLIIIATSLIIIGVIIFAVVMTMLGWDFKRLSTDKYERNEYVITENFKNISVKTDTADVVFLTSSDSKIKVVSNEKKNVKHLVEVNGDTLNISVIDTRKWYDHIGISFGIPKITVYIPEGEYNNLTVKNATGDIKIPKGFIFGNADISVTTGDISLSSSVTGAINCKSTTGDIELNGIRCNTLTVMGTTGDTEMKDVIAAGKMTVRRTTGDVELESCDAAELFIKVTTGDVEGTLLSDKTFEVKSTTGRVNVPKSKSGGLCKVNSTSGHIEIDIKK